MARKDVQLKAVVACVDKLSPALDRQSKKAKSLERDLKVLGRASGNAMRQTGAFINQAVADVGKLTGLVGVSLAGAVASFSSYAASVDAAAAKTGVGVEQLQKFRFAATQNGSSAEVMDSALKHLNKTMAEAAAGKNKDAAEMFKKLGINLKDANGHIRSAEEVLPQLADAIKNNENPAVRLRIAMAAMGKAGQDLVPTFEKGRAGLDILGEEAVKFGLVSSPEAIKAGEKLDRTFGMVKTNATVTSGVIVQALEPAISSASESVMRWTTNNRELIQTKTKEWADMTADAFQKIPWDAVAAGLGLLLGGKTLIQAGKMAKAFWDLAMAMRATAFAHPLAAGAAVAAAGGVALYSFANKHGKSLYSTDDQDNEDAATSGMGLFEQSIANNPQHVAPDVLQAAAGIQRPMVADLTITVQQPDGTELATNQIQMQSGARVSGNAGTIRIDDSRGGDL